MTAVATDSNRTYFLRPIPEINKAADLLDEAANMILARQHDRARELIFEANMPVVFAFAASIVGPNNPSIHRVRQIIGAPPYLPKASQVPPMGSGTSTGKMVFARDGWRCRFCGIRVIRSEVRIKRASCKTPLTP